ncbi:DNA methyltransferase [Kamptonema sp. UHCC 0994]|uniref:Eco57I restriction-modification methylase domain-containing protein n=1 Tax=Kamptonema sp. UHCC 0994 TaxID=3031329 RepID=UPI0023B8CBC4|nr:DNA methyltransferase [Kamptonema sp. UHCC 0994]MDF0553298.1 Eco57I restriction-modification methylase domain-containing protein [Kamptonema sp. UHCC 0994]
MTNPELQNSVDKILSSLQGLNSLKKLFSELNYNPVNQSLSRRGWREQVSEVLAEDPILIAAGGDDFHVIYGCFNQRLLVKTERLVVEELLKNHPYSLFVFSDKQQKNWTFINVKYDSRQDNKRILRRIRVSPGEQLRTAIERLSLLDLEGLDLDSPLAIQQRHDEAFDVEKVTQKFFKQYREVFENVERLITPTIDNAEKRRLFIQKLFNRLMFIVFIQKKGWLNFKEKTHYLEALWRDYQLDRSIADKNFYRDRLTHLFFSGLNNSQAVDMIGINNGGYLKQIIGTVPYLNGGLFEQDEEDRDPTIIVPDAAVDSIIHDLFNNFNFTVTESTPLDVEVAVDPEMLGKVFEELVTGRHESGSYYTPKPIVSFMGREALKGYLGSKLPAESREAIAEFVDRHNGVNFKNPRAVLQAIEQVKVCDPACGSGAYLMGMLHELLDLSQCLFASQTWESKTVYEFKLQIIENNIYGVDLDPFAVNIARLRLWLSLAVEYEGNDPPPLPNLKFKIEDSDSLIAPNPQGSGMLRDDIIRQFRELKAQYLRAHLGGEKQRLIVEIEKIKTNISLLTHGSAKVAGFDWAVDFAEVFADGGFDIIVANPPYVRMELFKEIKPTLRKNFPEVHSDRADLYCYFYGRALQLLKQGGMLAFISPNKWFRAKYGEKLKKHIAETCQVYSITDFGDLPVFESATTYPMIFIAQKGNKANNSLIFTEVESLEFPYPDVLAIIQKYGKILSNEVLNGSSWLLTVTTKQPGIVLGEYAKDKIFYGIKCGLSKAFFIDGNQRLELIRKSPKSIEIIKPLAVGKDIRKWRINAQDKWLLYMYHGIDTTALESVIEYLQLYKQELENRATKQEWYELQQPQFRYAPAFEKPKIVYQRFQVKPCFAYDDKGMYINDAVWTISVDDFYLLGVLNSQSFWLEISRYCTKIQNGYQLLRSYIEKAIIPHASEAEKSAISELVQKCLDAKGVNCEQWEKEIDERVAALYGL